MKQKHNSGLCPCDLYCYMSLSQDRTMSRPSPKWWWSSGKGNNLIVLHQKYIQGLKFMLCSFTQFCYLMLNCGKFAKYRFCTCICDLLCIMHFCQ